MSPFTLDDAQPIGAGSTATRSMSDWNPTLYMKFEDERMRAARDLLAQVPLASAGLVYDLGCGPGNSAELLAHRFPDARIVGLDTSDAMLAHARERAPTAQFVKRTSRTGSRTSSQISSSPMRRCISCPITTGSSRVSPPIWRRAGCWRPKCRTTPASLRMR